MKSWRTRVAGGGRYSSEQACESEARQDYVDTGRYSEVDCVDKGGSFYEIWVR
ncbi:hypothetical protein [Streptomyces sp. NPDC017529]|uniref:hypothetical protein n=1 Tax=Streptomyces sp. NPDC017529 TaxID=3365000 RepID=UPI0037A7641A